MVGPVKLQIDLVSPNRDRTLSLKEFLEVIKLSSKNVTDSLKESGEVKIQLSFKSVFRLSKNIDENPRKYLRGNIKVIMMSEEIYEIIKALFKSLLNLNHFSI